MEKIYERVAVMEKKAEHLEHRVEMMERNHEAINELKTAVEILALTNENQNKQIEQQSHQFAMVSKSMEAVNENLVNLNTEQREMRLEVSRQGDRLEKIEKVQEEATISVGSLVKSIITTFLIGLGVFAIGFLAVQFGTK